MPSDEYPLYGPYRAFVLSTRGRPRRVCHTTYECVSAQNVDNPRMVNPGDRPDLRQCKRCANGGQNPTPVGGRTGLVRRLEQMDLSEVPKL